MSQRPIADVHTWAVMCRLVRHRYMLYAFQASHIGPAMIFKAGFRKQSHARQVHIGRDYGRTPNH